MPLDEIEPTYNERTFHEDEIIVSKTDEKGRITYANDVFLKLALYEEDEVLGAPHSLVRHPDMPRAIFKVLWDTILNGEEIFAYVMNMAKNGDHYWVFAHVTPSFDANGNISGFHSNRRVPEPGPLAKVKTLYQQLLAEENRHPNRKDGMNASLQVLTELLAENGQTYEEYVFSL
jgi:PAS domain S-box-containing protein